LIAIGFPKLLQFAGKEFGGVTAEVSSVVLYDRGYPAKQF
jgi:hypothetical protein